MINITIPVFNTPFIAKQIKKYIEELENPEEYVLSLQLSYRDSNTLIWLHQVKEIKFNDLNKNFLEIINDTNSVQFFNYDNILEYSIVNAEEVF